MHRGNTEPVIKRMIELPSPRGVRVASEPHGHRDRLRRGCRPREGCGLHHKRNLLEDQIEAHLVAVPVRARAASTAIPQYLPKGTEVAVPVGGA